MAKKTENIENKALWTARAKYPVSRNRRQRQQQYQQQMTVLIAVFAVTVIAGAIFVLANWRRAGSIKTVDCATFPQYCVPLAGGSEEYDKLEAPETRVLDTESEGAEGVVRYIDGNIPTIGDPNAPVHFRTVSNFTCSHCATFHSGDMEKFIENYVLAGQATFGFVMVTAGQPLSQTAALSALCAGEQGALWEMSDELYRLAKSKGAGGLTLGTIRDSAENMGLDDSQLARCVTDAYYMRLLEDQVTFAVDNGVTGTPTVFVSYGDSDQWTMVSRDYNTLVRITEEANAQ